MPDLVDLRSDTVTRPTPEMRRAMADAEVGDDVWRDDPTVQALEERAAELLGKEAGLFVASGTMGNLVALMSHVPRGGEIIAEAEAHTVLDEAAGHAVVVGASARGIPARADGTMDSDAVAAAFRDPQDEHEPITALVTLENTHSHTMGQPLDADYTASVAAVAHGRDVPLHIDGARLFNAAVALGTPARELVAGANSVTFCLSKGLGCPVGSMFVSSRDVVWRARRARKLLGGAMRQVGVLAAPGLIALRDGPTGMIDRLADDHARARRLANGLAAMPGVSGLEPERVRTNFVVFRVPDRDAVLHEAGRQGVLLAGWPHGMIRAVTHHDVDDAGIERAISVLGRVLRQTSGMATTAR